MKNIQTYRQSKQRNEIYSLLCATKSHPTASWLYDQLKPKYPQLSLGTVYRNLNILVAQGQIRVLAEGSTFDRYDADISCHAHLFCEACGGVFDFPLVLSKEWTTNIESQTGFKCQEYRLDFHGKCATCRDKKE